MKQRVLLISCEGLGRGGVQAVMMSIVRGLSHVFIFDIVLFTAEKRYYDDEFLSHGGSIYRITKYEGNSRVIRGLDILFRGRRIQKELSELIEKKGPYAVIHCNNEYESGVCLKVAFKEGIPIRLTHGHVIHMQSPHKIINAMNAHYKKYIDEYATLKIGCSKEAAESLYGRDQQYVVIPNPLEKRFAQHTFPPNRRDRLDLLQVGRFSTNKNQLFTVAVFRLIAEKCPDATLSFVGSDTGEYSSEIRAEVSRLKLDNGVRYYPAEADIPQLMSQSSAFLLPSISEGFGIVLIEAQAMGVRCYASDTVPRSTNCGGCTYLSLNNGAEKWASTIVSDFEKSSGRRESFDCSAFFEERVIPEYEKIYKGEAV